MIAGNNALQYNFPENEYDIFSKLENISKKYTRGSRSFEVFTNYNLEVKRNELLVLSGRSGSGKSTLLALLGGYLKADEGKVFFDGTNLSSKKDDELSHLHAERIAYLPQSNVMVSEFTVLENVMLKSLMAGDSDTTKKALSLLDLFGIGTLADRFPHELSGGELRRVSLARLFVGNPDLYLIDEPSGGLDKEATRIVMEYLKDRVRDGKTVVVATHDDIVKEYADRILEI